MPLPNFAPLKHRKRTGKHTCSPTRGAFLSAGILDEQGSKSTDICRSPTLCVQRRFRPSEKTSLQKSPYEGMDRGKPNLGNSDMLAPSWTFSTTTSRHYLIWTQRAL